MTHPTRDKLSAKMDVMPAIMGLASTRNGFDGQTRGANPITYLPRTNETVKELMGGEATRLVIKRSIDGPALVYEELTAMKVCDLASCTIKFHGHDLQFKRTGDPMFPDTYSWTLYPLSRKTEETVFGKHEQILMQAREIKSNVPATTILETINEVASKLLLLRQ
jgi:hypothetical protein